MGLAKPPRVARSRQTRRDLFDSQLLSARPAAHQGLVSFVCALPIAWEKGGR